LKLKLDENLGKSVATILENAGHNVETITGEGLRGAKDKEVIAVCKTEGRCLVTLDLGFGNPLVFDPGQYSGIAVLRLPQRPSYDDLLKTCRTLIAALQHEDITGRLWIVETRRVRQYRPDRTEDE